MGAFVDRLRKNFERGNGLSRDANPPPQVEREPSPEPSPEDRLKVILGPWASQAPALFYVTLDELIEGASEMASSSFKQEHPLAASYATGIEDAFKQLQSAFKQWS